MRQRNIKNLKEKLEMNSGFLIERPAELKGRWSGVFGEPNPISLEIGCGKGQFITKCAESCPKRNFIAIEGQSNVALRALEKAEAKRLENLRIFISYVDDLKEFFEKGELSSIFLNFSDPWPKARHAKRRLTHRRRLINYKEVLAPDGFVELKTDNDGLFEFTLEEIKEAGLEILEQTRDLRGSAVPTVLEATRGSAALTTCEAAGSAEPLAFPETANGYASLASVITTEYEDRFREKGKNINYVKFR